MKPATAAVAPAKTAPAKIAAPVRKESAALLAITPVLVPLNHLVAHSKIGNRPLDKAHIADLTASIAASGLDTPLVSFGGKDAASTMKLGEDSVPQNFLIAGFHRREALKALKKSDPKRFAALFPEDLIPVRRTFGEIKDAVLMQLRENAARKDPLPNEIFPKLTQLKDEFGMKSNAIAKQIGKSESWVSRMLQVGEQLGKDVSDAVANNEVGVEDAAQAAADVKKAKKAGKVVDTKAVVDKLKAKKATTAAKGNVRADKRVSAKTLHGRYLALPKIGAAQRLTLLEETLAYIAQADGADAVPTLLAADTSKPAKAAKPAAEEEEAE